MISVSPGIFCVRKEKGVITVRSYPTLVTPTPQYSSTSRLWIKRPNSFPNWVSLKRFNGMLLNILTFFEKKKKIFNALKMYETLLIPMAIPHRCSLSSFIGLHFTLFFSCFPPTTTLPPTPPSSLTLCPSLLPSLALGNPAAPGRKAKFYLNLGY